MLSVGPQGGLQRNEGPGPGRALLWAACLPGHSLQAPFFCSEVQEAKITEAKINEARENYRPAAARASLLYFILNDLNKINPIYQFSLKVSHPGRRSRAHLWVVLPTSPQCSLRTPKFMLATLQAFNVVFEKAIQDTTPAEEVKQRVINLTDEITYSVYMYTARGLFERDKLIFLAQVTFQVSRCFCAQTAASAAVRDSQACCAGSADSQDPFPGPTYQLTQIAM